MRLIITRHGKTVENENGILQGHNHGTLSDEGKNQAKKVAKRLKAVKIDVIYSSDLKRSSDTADEIAKYHPNAKLIYTVELRERDLGVLAGLRKTEADFSPPIKDAETLSEMFNRAKKFMEKIIKKHRDDSVLLVGHNGINCAIISYLQDGTYEDIMRLDHQHNTAINIYELTNGKIRRLVFNDVSHLKN